MEEARLARARSLFVPSASPNAVRCGKNRRHSSASDPPRQLAAAARQRCRRSVKKPSRMARPASKLAG